jgi:hypothetical protein
MLIIGYKRTAFGVMFRVLNSWSRWWRDGGLCWLTADYIRWMHTTDLHIIYGWKRLTDRLAQ